MKTTLLISFSILSFALFGQQRLDPMGNPDANGSPYIPSAHTDRAADVVIINSFPAPTSGVLDITYDGQDLWVAEFQGGLVYRVSTTDGSVLSTLDLGYPYPAGLAFDGTNLWVVDKNIHVLDVISPVNGSLIDSYDTEQDGGDTSPQGLAWEGSNLWMNDSGSGNVTNPADSTFKLADEAAVAARYEAVGDYPSGLTSDGEYIWCSDNVADKIFKIDPDTFTVIDEIDLAGYDFPNGLAWDGTYLWFSDNGQDMIYQIDVSGTATKVDENPEDVELTVFPNPSSTGQFTFLIPEKAQQMQSTLTLWNSYGQLVAQRYVGMLPQLTVNIADASKGVYSYQLTSDKGLLAKGQIIK